MIFYTDDEWIKWFDLLSENNFVVIDNFLPEEICRLSRNHFLSHLESNGFRKAGIGAMADHQIKTSVRGDYVYWLYRDTDVDLEPFFLLCDELKEKLNRFCYLSLSGYEFHISHYPPGTHYARHIDQFRDRNNRLISIVIYLNESWQQGDGGELKIFTPEKEILIEPVSRKCVLFKSDKLEHEVLHTNVSRYSLTGWMLYQPGGVGYLG